MSAAGGSGLTTTATSGGSGTPEKDSAIWTDKESYLLDKGLELFGRSWSRLAQYIGSKTSYQVRNHVKSLGGSSASSNSFSTTGSSSLELPTCSALNNQHLCFSELIDDMEIPASIEEVIATVTTACPTTQGGSPPKPRQSSASVSSCKIGSSTSIGGLNFQSRSQPVSSSSEETKRRKKLMKNRNRGRKVQVRGRGRPRKERNVEGREVRRAAPASSSSEPGEDSGCPPSSSSSLSLSFDRGEGGGGSGGGSGLFPHFTLTDGQNSIILPSGEQVIRIQRDDLFEDDEVDVGDYSAEMHANRRPNTDRPERDLDDTGSSDDFSVVPQFTEKDKRLSLSNIGDKRPSLEASVTSATAVSKYVATIQKRLEDVYRLPPPSSERYLSEPNAVSDEEKRLHPELLARSEKNAGRYLKIRNYIVDSWLCSKPAYITKTSVRVGLKNCGDVNLISRVHAYLEQRGYINFGCSQCHYTTTVPNVEEKHTKVLPECSNSTEDEDDVDGERKSRTKVKVVKVVVAAPGTTSLLKTREQRLGTLQEPALAKASEKDNDPRPGKSFDHEDQLQNTVFTVHGGNRNTEPANQCSDEIKLIVCRDFTAEDPEPFSTVLMSEALSSAKAHAISDIDNEVIGLLGGAYDSERRRLTISVSVPCPSLTASRVSCEMCPVTQDEVSRLIVESGFKVVGWYHSHPKFRPDPSDVDIRTQSDFQRWFATSEGHPFVGLIVSPMASSGGRMVGDSILDDNDNIERKNYRLLYLRKSPTGELVPYILEPQLERRRKMNSAEVNADELKSTEKTVSPAAEPVLLEQGTSSSPSLQAGQYFNIE